MDVTDVITRCWRDIRRPVTKELVELASRRLSGMEGEGRFMILSNTFTFLYFELERAYLIDMRFSENSFALV